MATRDRIKLPSVSNVTSGGNFTLEVPLGKTIDKVYFVLGGDLTPAKVTDIKCLIGGKAIQEFASLEQLDLEINKYYGRDFGRADLVTWWFNTPEYDNNDQRRTTGLGTAQGVSTLHFEGKIAATSLNPQLTAYAVLSDARPLGLINIVRRFPRSFATAGQMEIDNLPRRGRIKAIHLIKSDVSSVEVVADKQTKFEFTKVLAQHEQKEYKRFPRAESTVVEFTSEGDIYQSLAMTGVINQQPWQIQDFRVKPTIDSAGTVDVLVEYLAVNGEV